MEFQFFFVYVLESLKDGGWYIGFSSNLKKRYESHNSGVNKSTKFRRPFRIIYFEGYVNRDDALGRERFLKSGSGRLFLKRQMNNYLKS